jgi:hypothetical protein
VRGSRSNAGRGCGRGENDRVDLARIGDEPGLVDGDGADDYGAPDERERPRRHVSGELNSAADHTTLTAKITRGDAETLGLTEGDTEYVRATRVHRFP